VLDNELVKVLCKNWKSYKPLQMTMCRMMKGVVLFIIYEYFVYSLYNNSIRYVFLCVEYTALAWFIYYVFISNYQSADYVSNVTNNSLFL